MKEDQLAKACASARLGDRRRRRNLIRILNKRTRKNAFTATLTYYLSIGTVPRGLWES